MYDTPGEVAEAFLSSLTETIEGVDAEDGHSPGLKAAWEAGRGAKLGRVGRRAARAEPGRLWWHQGNNRRGRSSWTPRAP